MDHCSEAIRIVCLPGCGQAWLGPLVDAVFNGSGVAVQWVVDANATVEPDAGVRTLALLRYPMDQLVAWFDELCAMEPKLDTPQHWMGQTRGMASNWQWFARRWLLERQSDRCMDVDTINQNPMRLIEAVASLAGCDVPQAAARLSVEALGNRPDPSFLHGFRYYGPGFERVLAGHFAACPLVNLDLQLLCLDPALGDGSIHESAIGNAGNRSSVRAIATKVDDRFEVDERFSGAPVVILTCTKVGSKSILTTISATPELATGRIFDVHLLAEKSRALAATALTPDSDDHTLASAAAQSSVADEIHATIIAPDAPARVITAVRDPIEQIVSMFFQKIQSRYVGAIDDPEQTARDLMPAFESWRDPCWMQRWFDIDYTCLVNAPVSELAVDPSAGGGIGLFGNRAVLLLRCGDDVSVQRPLLERFFGRPGLRIPRVHKTADKPLGRVYAAFKSMWRPDEATLEAAFGQPVIRQCYTPREIDAMMARWQKPAACAA